MKRLLITMEYPPDVGGVAEYYKGLVSAFPQGSVRVLTPRDCRFFARWLWPHWLPLLWNAWRTIRREKPDEVWVGQILPVGTVVWILQKLLLPTTYHLQPTIFCHGMDILMCGRSPWKRALARRILQCADRVIANSEFTKRELQKIGVMGDKICIVYPCPRLEFQISDLKCQVLHERYGLNGKKVLLTAARLVYRKGIDLVIEAMRDVTKRVPDLVYVILGDGPERQKLQSLAMRYSLPVTFVGVVTNLHERAAWFSIADIYISTPRTLPYDVESFGLVYLEANLFGKPVIGSRSGGVPEAVIDGETGLLVPENDVLAITQAITRLLTEKNLAQQLGEQGRKRVADVFQWRRQIEKIGK